MVYIYALSTKSNAFNRAIPCFRMQTLRGAFISVYTNITNDFFPTHTNTHLSPRTSSPFWGYCHTYDKHHHAMLLKLHNREITGGNRLVIRGRRCLGATQNRKPKILSVRLYKRLSWIAAALSFDGLNFIDCRNWLFAFWLMYTYNTIYDMFICSLLLIFDAQSAWLSLWIFMVDMNWVYRITLKQWKRPHLLVGMSHWQFY